MDYGAIEVGICMLSYTHSHGQVESRGVNVFAWYFKKILRFVGAEKLYMTSNRSVVLLEQVL